MNTKQFAQEAIKNGYTEKGLCEGWEWIKQNLSELDGIFQLAEYKKQNGMKYKCMPFLVAGEKLNITEENALSAAWYLNNEREHNKEKEDYKNKMLADGYIPLTEEVCKTAYANKQRLAVVASMSTDWITRKVEETYKPFVDNKGVCWLMKPRQRTKGYYLSSFESAFCKII